MSTPNAAEQTTSKESLPRTLNKQSSEKQQQVSIADLALPFVGETMRYDDAKIRRKASEAFKKSVLLCFFGTEFEKGGHLNGSGCLRRQLQHRAAMDCLMHMVYTTG